MNPEKSKLLEQLQETVGEHYFECLNFCSILNMLREEIQFNDPKIDDKLEEAFKLIRKEAETELE